MIFRRYGTSYQSVEMDFDAKALNEVGFRRDRASSIPVEEMDARYEVESTHELTEEASGAVQSETEQAMLDQLEGRVRAILDGLDEGGIVVVENDQGHDWPKPRQLTKNVIEHGENRLFFEYSMAPSLRLTVRRPKG